MNKAIWEILVSAVIGQLAMDCSIVHRYSFSERLPCFCDLAVTM